MGSFSWGSRFEGTICTASFEQVWCLASQPVALLPMELCNGLMPQHYSGRWLPSASGLPKHFRSSLDKLSISTFRADDTDETLFSAGAQGGLQSFRNFLARGLFRMEGLFFGALFLAPFCFSPGKKERQKRGDAYVERAGPQAPKGVLGCNTLKPSKKYCIATLYSFKRVLHCNTLKP